MPNGAAPFLKWAGGKTRLLSEILPRLPARMDTYFEPFLGGAAVFFAVAREERFRRAVLSDRNLGLVEVYRCVKTRVEELIDALEPLATKATDPSHYYAVRAQNPDELTAVERCARFIFLNKTCFNGLYRVNRSGRFNVPFGRYKRPRVFDPDRLRAASEALAKAEIREADFQEVMAEAGPADGMYLDPPYVPVSDTACFTSYTPFPFGADEHRRLKSTYLATLERRTRALLSNSDCAFTRELYEGLEVRTVPVGRAINRDPRGRGPVNELLVLGRAARDHRWVRPGIRRGAA
ncbi:MAG: DNA adenine methylase [Myxococcota bacterium]